MTSLPSAAVLTSLLFCKAVVWVGPIPGIRPHVQEPDSAAIEVRLFELLNGERISSGLRPLVLSEALTLAARAHSREMAGRNVLSHFSSDGRACSDRLADAGVFYRSCGENVVFSETRMADIIHQELMASPGHRSQILEAEVDAVGLGVVRTPSGGYYVTQDFVQALVPVPVAEAEAGLRRRVETARAEASLPPFRILEEMTQPARDFGRLRSEKKPPPSFPERYGGVSAYIVTSTSLESAGVVSGPLLETKYVGLAIGVHFGRSAEHPGGAYVMVFLLIRGRA